MLIYGYENDSDQLLKLKESCIECSLDELDKLIRFLQYVKDEHGKIAGESNYAHSHYRDWDNAWSNSSSDFIITTKMNSKN